MKKSLFPFFLLLLVVNVLTAQVISLDTVINFPFTTNSLGDVGTSDCWGWTDSLGVDYAIVGNIDHVAFVRASDGAVLDTVQLSSIGDGYYHRAIVARGHYCYAVTEMHGKREGMATIDMRYLPDSVHFVGAYNASGTMVRSHEIDVDKTQPYLYLEADEILGQQGIEIFNISDPENPFKEGFIAVPNTHDMTARNDTVWVAEGYTPAFSVWDCTDKGNPILLGRILDNNFGYCHGIFPSPDGKYFFTTEETPTKTVKVWDAHDLNNIFLRGQYLGNNQLAHNVYPYGSDLLVFSHYTTGVTIVDWSNPDNLVEIASFDTYPQNEIGDFYGTWAAYPYTTNGYIYASNFEGKLFILNWDRNALTAENAQPKIEGRCWPNPFSTVTNIPLQLDAAAAVFVDVFNLEGRKIETLFAEHLNAGKYSLPWHPAASLSAGTYLLKIQAGEQIRTERIVFQAQ